MVTKMVGFSSCNSTHLISLIGDDDEEEDDDPDEVGLGYLHSSRVLQVSARDPIFI